MKALIVALALTLAACSGFNKPVSDKTTELILTPSGEQIRAGLPSLPLTVWAEDEYKPDTVEAVAWWNEQVGMELMAVINLPIGPDIAVWDGGASPYLGMTTFVPVPPGAKSRFRYARVPHIAMHGHRSRTMKHELGHALGLKHDNDNPRSIMCQTGKAKGKSSLEEIDRLLIQQIYGYSSYQPLIKVTPEDAL